MVIPCDEYYEHVLGDSCDNDCEYCYADKELVFAKKAFDLPHFDCILDTTHIKKGTGFFIWSENAKKVILSAGQKGHFLTFQRPYFEELFSYEPVE